MTRLIGISGKPGSVKTYFGFKILQELRFHGYNAILVSIAAPLYSELNSIIKDVHLLDTDSAPESGYAELLNKYRLPQEQGLALFSLLHADGLGEFNPEYGYSRRNENMRKALSLLGSGIRRELDEDYWIDAMIDNLPEDAEFAIFTDLRFPNEANYLRDNDGMSIRIDLDAEQFKRQSSENDGFKYSAEGLKDVTETALDDYPDFYAHITHASFNRVRFGKEILDFYGLPHQPERTFNGIVLNN